MSEHTPKLKPEVKAKWLEALRSGNYRQGRGLLRNLENDYCCLGVLCDVDTETEQCWYLGFGAYKFGVNESTVELEYFQRLCVPDKQTSLLHYHDIRQRLIRMNDKEGKSFTEIADYIEENL
jgi:hypothetical protein